MVTGLLTSEHSLVWTESTQKAFSWITTQERMLKCPGLTKEEKERRKKGKIKRTGKMGERSCFKLWTV